MHPQFEIIMAENNQNKLGSHVKLSEEANSFYSAKRVQKGKQKHTLANILEILLEAAAKDESLVDRLIDLKK